MDAYVLGNKNNWRAFCAYIRSLLMYNWIMSLNPMSFYAWFVYRHSVMVAGPFSYVFFFRNQWNWASKKMKHELKIIQLIAFIAVRIRSSSREACLVIFIQSIQGAVWISSRRETHIIWMRRISSLLCVTRVYFSPLRRLVSSYVLMWIYLFLIFENMS